MNILWLITARSGSKSIIDKNIKLLGNKPLLAYRIEQAKLTTIDNKIWLSTDSKKYAEIGEEFGAEIPFIRPEYLSTDDANSIEVVLHAMDFARNKNLKFDFIGLLEPTSPFISSSQLMEAVQILLNDVNANAIVAVKESRPNTFFIQPHLKYLNILSERFINTKKLGRQHFEKEITPSGGFYISKWENFLKFKTFYTPTTIPYLVDDISALEIDEPIDWDFADFLINNKNKQ